jgi:hypothetical protein
MLILLIQRAKDQEQFWIRFLFSENVKGKGKAIPVTDRGGP